MQSTIAHNSAQQSVKTLERSEEFKLVKLPLDIEAQLAVPYAETYEYTGDRHVVSETYIDYDGGEYDECDEFVLDRVNRLTYGGGVDELASIEDEYIY